MKPSVNVVEITFEINLERTFVQKIKYIFVLGVYFRSFAANWTDIQFTRRSYKVTIRSGHQISPKKYFRNGERGSFPRVVVISLAVSTVIKRT